VNFRVIPLFLLLFTLAFGARAQSPHGQAEAPPATDRVEPAPELPRGSIEAVLLDGNEQPLANREVRLGILFQKIAEGESRSTKTAKTNESETPPLFGPSIGTG